MKIEVGMYVRSDNGMKFGRVIRVHTLIRKIWVELDNGERIDVLELTKNKIRDNIIDLIEDIAGEYLRANGESHNKFYFSKQIKSIRKVDLMYLFPNISSRD